MARKMVVDAPDGRIHVQKVVPTTKLETEDRKPEHEPVVDAASVRVPLRRCAQCRDDVANSARHRQSVARRPRRDSTGDLLGTEFRVTDDDFGRVRAIRQVNDLDPETVTTVEIDRDGLVCVADGDLHLLARLIVDVDHDLGLLRAVPAVPDPDVGREDVLKHR